MANEPTTWAVLDGLWTDRVAGRRPNGRTCVAPQQQHAIQSTATPFQQKVRGARVR